jgi:hypothetical protein
VAAAAEVRARANAQMLAAVSGPAARQEMAMREKAAAAGAESAEEVDGVVAGAQGDEQDGVAGRGADEDDDDDDDDGRGLRSFTLELNLSNPGHIHELNSVSGLLSNIWY